MRDLEVWVSCGNGHKFECLHLPEFILHWANLEFCALQNWWIFSPFRMLRIMTCILSLVGLTWKNFISKFSAQSWQQRMPWIGSALYIGALDTLHLIFPKLTFCIPRVLMLKNILQAVRTESYKETEASLRSPTKRLEQNQITCSWLNFICFNCLGIGCLFLGEVGATIHSSQTRHRQTREWFDSNPAWWTREFTGVIYRKMNHGNAHLSIVQWIPKLTSLDLLDHLQIVPLVRESPLPGDCYDSYNLGKELVTLLYFKNLRLVTLFTFWALEVLSSWDLPSFPLPVEGNIYTTNGCVCLAFPLLDRSKVSQPPLWQDCI